MNDKKYALQSACIAGGKSIVDLVVQQIKIIAEERRYVGRNFDSIKFEYKINENK